MKEPLRGQLAAEKPLAGRALEKPWLEKRPAEQPLWGNALLQGERRAMGERRAVGERRAKRPLQEGIACARNIVHVFSPLLLVED